MAQFFGSMKGARGETTRLGNKNSGISAHLRGWSIGVRVSVYVDDNGKDHVQVWRTSGSNGNSPDVFLASFSEESGAVKAA